MADAIETNEANIIGVRPAIDQDSIRCFNQRPSYSTLVKVFGEANNSSTAVYTVPSGKTLKLCNAIISLANASGAVGTGYVQILDTTPTIYFYLIYEILNIDVSSSLAINFDVPLELPAGHTIQAVSNKADLNTIVSISGYL